MDSRFLPTDDDEDLIWASSIRCLKPFQVRRPYLLFIHCPSPVVVVVQVQPCPVDRLLQAFLPPWMISFLTDLWLRVARYRFIFKIFS